MPAKRAKISQATPLIVEPHPEDYEGYPFITLIQYNKKDFLTIIDNSDDSKVGAYVLDMCGPESVDEETVISIANHWYHNSKDRYPLSFEFSIQNMSHLTCRIFKTFSTDFITRIIGPMPSFNMEPKRNVRRRKRKEIPANMPVKTVTLD